MLRLGKNVTHKYPYNDLKTAAELKFDALIKDVFHSTLKSLGYKKKGNNFYLQVNGIGKIINLQKSVHNTKDIISFTINISLFSPEYWDAYYNWFDKPIPEFPSEAECMIRHRIGNFLNTSDSWFEINATTDIDYLITEQLYNLKYVILPYLNGINSAEDIVIDIDKRRPGLSKSPITKLFLLCQLGKMIEASVEYNTMLAEAESIRLRNDIKEFGEKYKLT